MIRHYDPLIELHVCAKGRCPFPLFVDDASEVGANSRFAFDATEGATLFECADRYEVRCTTVEKLRQADAFAGGAGHRTERTSDLMLRGRALCVPTVARRRARRRAFRPGRGAQRAPSP